MSPSIASSPNGWTDNELTALWFEQVFVPEDMAERVDEDKPIVLTVDGHN